MTNRLPERTPPAEIPLAWVVLTSALLLASCGSAPREAAGPDDAAQPLTSKGNTSSPPPGAPKLLPLGRLPVPKPPVTSIRNEAAAIRLGKALFWDMQLGSDGKTACASCHYSGGADNRMANTVNPGPNITWEAVSGPGETFAFEPDESVSDHIDFEPPAGDDIIGSQGVIRAKFEGIDPDPAATEDKCTTEEHPHFLNFRQVTGRNAPTMIGAAFNREQFWDGRANFVFNGFNPFGFTGNDTDSGGSSDLSRFRPFGNIGNIDRGRLGYGAIGGSLASQAVGPLTNDVEMSCAGRLINGPNGIGGKMLLQQWDPATNTHITRKPLAKQKVHPQDSVLGKLADKTGGTGLNTTYQAMINEAFKPEVASNAVTLFSVIFGESVAAYERTLIPSQTPFDRFLEGNAGALTAQQKEGMSIFFGRGGCSECHAGTEMSDATVSFSLLNGLINVNGGDQGFHNIGVRPTQEDLGRAGTGPGGVSFSVSGSEFDKGAFKTPQLRNLKLTAPYFHNGSRATMHDVVDFYEDGPDFDNDGQMSRLMDNIDLKSDDHAPLEDFLLNALLDCRVEKRRAPFDSPSLEIPNGPNLPETGASGTGTCS